MNTALLKLARRHRDGCRIWIVPGAENAAMLIPASRTLPDWGPAFHWPDVDGNGDPLRRGVDLNRHRGIARRAVRQLLEQAAEAA